MIVDFTEIATGTPLGSATLGHNGQVTCTTPAVEAVLAGRRRSTPEQALAFYGAGWSNGYVESATRPEAR
jgi:hypothetical protein